MILYIIHLWLLYKAEKANINVVIKAIYAQILKNVCAKPITYALYLHYVLYLNHLELNLESKCPTFIWVNTIASLMFSTYSLLGYSYNQVRIFDVI